MQKYSAVIVNKGFKTEGVVMINDDLGEYIKYSDYIKQTEKLRDCNYSLQDQTVDLSQQLYHAKLNNEVLLSANRRLSQRVEQQSREITAISDKLNRTYISDRANKKSSFSEEMLEYLRDG